MRKVMVFGGLLVCAMGVPRGSMVYAQTYSAAEVLRFVETEHPLVAVWEAELVAKRAVDQQALAWDEPLVGYAREGIGDGVDYVEQRFVLSQTLPSFGQRRYARHRMAAEQTALVWQHRDQRLALQAAVKDALITAQYAQQMVSLHAEASILAERVVHAAQLREAAGEQAGLETMRAQMAWEAARLAHAQTEAAYREAVEAVRRIAALPAGVTLAAVPPLVFADVAVTQAEVEAALPSVPTLQRARAQVQATEFGVQEARNAWMPQLSADVFPQDFGDGFTSMGFQVGVRLPLPGGVAVRSPKRIAQAHLREAQERVLLAERSIQRDATSAWAGYEAARAHVLRYHDSIAPQADTLLVAMQQGYVRGEVSLVGLLDAQQAALRAQVQYTEVLYIYLKRVLTLERLMQRTWLTF